MRDYKASIFEHLGCFFRHDAGISVVIRVSMVMQVREGSLYCHGR